MPKKTENKKAKKRGRLRRVAIGSDFILSLLSLSLLETGKWRKKSKKNGLKGSNQLFSLYRSYEMHLLLVEILQHSVYCPVGLVD